MARVITAQVDAPPVATIEQPPGGQRQCLCFAHGFVALEENTEVLYKVTNYYAPTHDRGVLWNDPELGIPWPVSPEEAVLSDKDARLPTLAKAADLFD